FVYGHIRHSRTAGFVYGHIRHSRTAGFVYGHIRHYRTAGFVYGHREEPPADTIPHQAANESLSLGCHPVARRLIDLYRRHGHRQAALDPLGLASKEVDEELSNLLNRIDPDEAVSVDSIPSDFSSCATRLGDLAKQLETIYCGQLSAEFDHLADWRERIWFAKRFEACREEFNPNETEIVRMAEVMSQSQIVDEFLGAKFGSVKRYGGEGCESLLVAMDRLIERGCSTAGLSNMIVGIAHRGRNNLLTVLLDLPAHLYFRKMRGLSEFPDGCTETEGFTGDTFSHYFQSVAKRYGEKSITVSLIPNPSHLEACVPVAAGKTRSKMQRLGEGDYREDTTEGSSSSSSRNGDSTCCVLIHGDASIVGQGIVYETLAMAEVPHYSIGGTIHIVVNNQVGYTTPSDRGSSFRHCTDVGKSLAVPVIHVNADNPVDVYRAATLALDYRQVFRRDVFINLVCYRRWGHNELDEPSFTQPLMYKAIRARQSTADKFVSSLDSNLQSQVADSCSKWRQHLSDELALSESVKIDQYVRKGDWSSVRPPERRLTVWDTGFDTDKLKRIATASVATKDSTFQLHPTLVKGHVAKRLERLATGMDWATAECLAIGSLMLQGRHCRISGQDVGRGTFSQRHAMLVDQAGGAIDVPLNRLADASGRLEIANSILSEEAVLGFEFGMAMDQPDRLCIWEAQFGDFFNGAQIIIDTYIGSAEAKWGHQNGLVLLLPHGYDGAGPEHSSCRIERWLQLTDSSEVESDTDMVNMQVVNPTTPAQYFHLLRRQLIGRKFRKPLIVVSPKTLLRHPAAVSSLEELAPGRHFQHVLPDPSAPQSPKRIIMCTGKHYYALDEYRRAKSIKDAAIIRVEQLTPFPLHDVHAQLAKYPNARELVWSQEEPRNMGAWSFVEARLRNLLGLTGVRYAGRKELATPAVGIGSLHRSEADQLMTDAFFL
uniref:Transket_pyr domain-containing protein n=2 Tax=Macrostomum lignano TaxID=282301 RepID=A0A1I8J8E7_9PLAT